MRLPVHSRTSAFRAMTTSYCPARLVPLPRHLEELEGLLHSIAVRIADTDAHGAPRLLPSRITGPANTSLSQSRAPAPQTPAVPTSAPVRACRLICFFQYPVANRGSVELGIQRFDILIRQFVRRQVVVPDIAGLQPEELRLRGREQLGHMRALYRPVGNGRVDPVRPRVAIGKDEDRQVPGKAYPVEQPARRRAGWPLRWRRIALCSSSNPFSISRSYIPPVSMAMTNFAS